MSETLAGFLRDEIAELLRGEIESEGSDATVTERDAGELVVVDDDGNSFLVSVTPFVGRL